MGILGVKQTTMYRLLAEHQIPYVKVGGRKQVNEDDLRRYIRQQTSHPIAKDDLKGERFKYVPGMKIIS